MLDDVHCRDRVSLRNGQVEIIAPVWDCPPLTRYIVTGGRSITCAWRWCNMSIGNLMPSAPLAPLPVSTTAVLRPQSPLAPQTPRTREPPCLPIPLPPTQNTRIKTNNIKNGRAKDAMQYLATPPEQSPPPGRGLGPTGPPQTDHPAPPPWPPFCAWHPRQTRRRPFWRPRRPPCHRRTRHRRRRPC